MLSEEFKAWPWLGEAGAAGRVVYLHIGMHKTASTYIQNRFRCNRELLAKQGLLYPDLRRDHLALVNAVANRESFLWLSWLAKAANMEAQLLISAEAFSLELANSKLGEAGGAWLHELLATSGWDLRIITFVRDQASYLNSRYTQLVKRLHTLSSFNRYVRRVAKGGSESECDMLALFGWILVRPTLQAVFLPFGGCACDATPSPPSSSDPFDQLLVFLPLPTGLVFAPAPPSATNQQPGEVGVKLARHFGRHLKKHHPELLAQSAYRAEARQLIERLVARHQWHLTPFNDLTSTLLEEIDMTYSEGKAQGLGATTLLGILFSLPEQGSPRPYPIRPFISTISAKTFAPAAPAQ